MAGKGNYEVGYGKPPMATRWRKGQSGNELGRPKKRTSLTDEVDAVLEEKVPLLAEGKRRLVTKKRAIALQVVNQAVSGKAPAQNLVFAVNQRPAAGDVGQPATDATDEAILQFYLSSRPRTEGGGG